MVVSIELVDSEYLKLSSSINCLEMKMTKNITVSKHILNNVDVIMNEFNQKNVSRHMEIYLFVRFLEKSYFLNGKHGNNTI